MGLFSWFSKGDDDAPFALVFDITSASVGAAVISYGERTPEIHYCERMPIQFPDDARGDALAGALKTAVARAASDAREALRSVDGFNGHFRVHAVIHAPWAHVHSQRAETMLDKEQTITKTVLRTFVDDEITPISDDTQTIFDQHLTRIELNGYDTDDPYDKPASQLAVTVINSTMTPAIHNAINNGFAEAFPQRTAHLDSFVYTVIQLRELLELPDTITIIDIGEEYTTATIVRDRAVVDTAAIQMGTEELIRAVSEDDAEGHRTALSLINMYMENSCTPAQCRQVEKALEPVAREWTSALGEACTKLARAHRMPPYAYVAVDRRFASWFERVVEKFDFSQFTTTARPFSVHRLHRDRIASKIHFAEDVRRDDLLTLAALSVDK